MGDDEIPSIDECVSMLLDDIGAEEHHRIFAGNITNMVLAEEEKNPNYWHRFSLILGIVVDAVYDMPNAVRKCLVAQGFDLKDIEDSYLAVRKYYPNA